MSLRKYSFGSEGQTVAFWAGPLEAYGTPRHQFQASLKYQSDGWVTPIHSDQDGVKMMKSVFQAWENRTIWITVYLEAPHVFKKPNMTTHTKMKI